VEAIRGPGIETATRWDVTMRFMLILKGDPAPGVLPSQEVIAAMGKYTEDLVKAGVLLASEGLHQSSTGARVRFSGGKRTVIDGPFTETKELIAGFFLIQVRSKEEAIEWASRCPVDVGLPDDQVAEIEIRQVAELSDLPEMTGEQRAQAERRRDQLAGS
jgi:hypothetical protein